MSWRALQDVCRINRQPHSYIAERDVPGIYSRAICYHYDPHDGGGGWEVAGEGRRNSVNIVTADRRWRKGRRRREMVQEEAGAISGHICVICNKILIAISFI